MDLRRLLAPPVHHLPGDVALLLTRAFAGVAFVLHGAGKVRDPFGWMGEDAFAPGLLQALAALAEFGGGLAWIAGLLTPLASLGIACTMVVAAGFHALGRGDPVFATGPGPSAEPALVYLCLALLLLALGPGRLSLDARLFGAPRRAPASDGGAR